MKQPKYRIYPSLLDKFQKFIDSDIEAESFMNIDRETGEQKYTADEISDRHEQELIDAINRVPKQPIEAADKGTCFNEIVDCIIENRKTSRDDMKIQTVNGYDKVDSFGACDETGKPIFYDEDHEYINQPCIYATINGFDFFFDISLCKSIAKYFRGSVCQHYCNATINTAYGLVELYGYADEIVKDKVFDIKTTSSYDFGKFEKSWQKDVYPYCLIESGDCTSIREFEYTVVKLKGGTKRMPLITGDVYKEVYTYNHEQSTIRLRQMLERFIEWLESNRDKITDKKIFNEL